MILPVFRLCHSIAPTVLWSVLIASAAACSAPGVMGGADADTGAGDEDGGFIAGQLDSGIGLIFVAEPPFGETFEHNDNVISVSSAEFTIVNLRLIGDAASGDSRTSKDLVELNLDSPKPVGVAYEDAPPGLYSRVRGTVIAFSIEGEVERDGEASVDFEVEQESGSLPFEFALDLNLEAGVPQIVDVVVDLKKITEEIPFEELSVEDGAIDIEDESEAMDKVEEKISDAFDVKD